MCFVELETHSEISCTVFEVLGLWRIQWRYDVPGLEKPEQFTDFEKRATLEHVSFIDAYIPSAGIIIYQKSSSVNLDAPAKQPDGTSASPF